MLDLQISGLDTSTTHSVNFINMMWRISLHTLTLWIHIFKFTSEPEKEGKLAFLDTCVCIHNDSSTKITVFRKLTHTDQYLNFHSNHHLQHKRFVVKTLFHRGDIFITSPEEYAQEISQLKITTINFGYLMQLIKPRPLPNRMHPIYLQIRFKYLSHTCDECQKSWPMYLINMELKFTMSLSTHFVLF